MGGAEVFSLGHAKLPQTKVCDTGFGACCLSAWLFLIEDLLQAWKPQHDIRLMAGVLKHGYGSWLVIAWDKHLQLQQALSTEIGQPSPSLRVPGATGQYTNSSTTWDCMALDLCKIAPCRYKLSRLVL